MHFAAVQSSTLATVAYDEAGQLLQLEFCNGAVYQQSAVPAIVHQALLGAASRGRYFNQIIRGRFAPCLLSSCQPGQIPAQRRGQG